VSCNNIKDLIKCLKQKRMRNKVMHIRKLWRPHRRETDGKRCHACQTYFCCRLKLRNFTHVLIYTQFKILLIIDSLSLNWYFRCVENLWISRSEKHLLTNRWQLTRKLVSSLDTQKLINTYEHLFKLHNCSAKRNSCSCSAAKSRIPAIITIYQ
jgi:hypothetical protein